MIELDVQLTGDGELVVLHDRELGRTTPGKGAVRERTLDELRALDAGAWFDPAYAGARVMSLDEVLALTAGRADLNVEIKSPEPDWEGTAGALVALLQCRSAIQRTLISSFDMGALRAVRRMSSTARLAVLWHRPDFGAAWRHAGELGAVALHPQARLVGGGLVERAHGLGYAVNVWTVNELRQMRRLLALGVDGLISDYPERFAAL